MYSLQADTYRYTAAGEFSAPYHYIDAEDNPPTTCGVVYSRDCGKTGCVVAAINNYVSLKTSIRKKISEERRRHGCKIPV